METSITVTLIRKPKLGTAMWIEINASIYPCLQYETISHISLGPASPLHVWL